MLENVTLENVILSVIEQSLEQFNFFEVNNNTARIT